MKNKLTVVLSLMAFVLLFAVQGVTAANGVLKIGILQLVEHDALDAAAKGFIDELADNGFIDGKTIEIDFQNAQGDQSNLQTISDRFVKNKMDLILAIATPAGQAIASATTDIPILVTAVTDLVAARLVESNEVPGTNVSGTTDMSPIDKQLELLMELFPKTKTVGVIYNSSEVNSEIQVNILKKEAVKFGLKIEEGTVTSVNDIDQVASSMVSKIDVMYVPTDNVIASAMPNLVMVTEKAGVPVICGEANQVKNGGTATAGLDYYKLGRQTGAMAVRLINNKEDIAKMPVESLQDVDIVLNQVSADALGIAFPQSVIEKAKEIIVK